MLRPTVDLLARDHDCHPHDGHHAPTTVTHDGHHAPDAGPLPPVLFEELTDVLAELILARLRRRALATGVPPSGYVREAPEARPEPA